MTKHPATVKKRVTGVATKKTMPWSGYRTVIVGIEAI
jgi:hypothetical protein